MQSGGGGGGWWLAVAVAMVVVAVAVAVAVVVETAVFLRLAPSLGQDLLYLPGRPLNPNTNTNHG